MFNSIKNKISKFKMPKFNLRINLEKFDLQLLVLLLVIQAALLAFSFYKGQYNFNINFIVSNLVQILIVLVGITLVFHFSYQAAVKKMPSVGLYLIFLFITLIFVYNTVGVIALIESYSGRAMFSTANYAFVYLSLIIMGLIYARFDMPVSINIRELYKNFTTNYYRHFGLVLALTGVVCILGFVDRTFVYTIGFLLMIDSAYLAKFFFANLKK